MGERALVMIATCDFCGIVRGKAVPANDLPRRLKSGIGWVPANQSISPFDAISPDDPYGPVGDLRLVPDPATDVRVGRSNDGLPLFFYLGDITHTDGRPWEGCPRGFLRSALNDLEAETGLTIKAAFEHEFTLQGLSGAGGAYSLRGLRTAEAYCETIMTLMAEAGIELEQFMPEFGRWQYEITQPAVTGLGAADQAVIVRELIVEAARQHDLRATMAPKVTADGVGNGVHIHFSLYDRNGAPVTGAGTAEAPLSPIASKFAAGIVRHLPALCALTAPSVPSYMRLIPHSWSASYSCLGYRNREASLRIAPVIDMPGTDTAIQTNLEYRAADATASPYHALGAIVRAGLAGIVGDYDPAPLVNQEPDSIERADKEKLGLVRLPTSLPEALAALAADETARSWLPNDLYAAFRAMKQGEVDACKELSPDEICAKYADAY